MALETADVAILTPHLDRVADLIQLSRQVRRVLVQNITLAVGIKLAVLVLALLGFASMWLAVMSDVGASLLVIANGMRLLRDVTPVHSSLTSPARQAWEFARGCQPERTG